jgi:hypothetical protein
VGKVVPVSGARSAAQHLRRPPRSGIHRADARRTSLRAPARPRSWNSAPLPWRERAPRRSGLKRESAGIVPMSNGVERRAQIDIETFKALLLINGGGVVSLLAIFSQIIREPGCEKLAIAIMVGVFILVVGLSCAVVHNVLRRSCSHHYDHHGMRPPKGRLFGIELPEPTVCFFSRRFLELSIAAFVIAAAFVAWAGIVVVQDRAKASAMTPKSLAACGAATTSRASAGRAGLD